MVDPKRLITGFLAVAFIASSAAFFLSNSGGSKLSPSEMEVSEGNGTLGQNQSAFGGQAYVESVPGSESSNSLAQANTDGDLLPPVSDPSNLTENVGQKLAEGMIQLDPQNSADINAQVNEVSKNAEGYTAGVANTQEIANQVNATRAELIAKSEDIDVLKNYGPEDIKNYTDKLNSILDENYVRSGVSDVLASDPTPTSISSVALVLEQTFLKIKALEVPEALANFHKSLLKLTLYQKQALELSQEENDPLKSSLVLQLQEQDYNDAIRNFGNELNKANSLGKLSSANKISGPFSLVKDLFLPKTAYGIFGFGDIVIDPVNLARKIWEWVQGVIKEKLKKKLINQIVNATQNWVKGKGQPRFAQDLIGTARSTFDAAIGAEIYKHLPQVCASIQPFITLAFKRPSNPRLADMTERTTCTLTEAVENVKEFYKSFDKGGWQDYFQVITPQNNPFGVMITLSDIALTKAQGAQAAQGQRVANAAGFLATRVCKNPTNPPLNLEDAYSLEDIRTSPDLVADAKAYAKQAGMDYIGPVKSDHTFKTCPQDGWEDTTPGKIVGETLAKATGLHDDWLVNANDMITIATAFIDSLIQKVFQKATNSEGEEPGFIATTTKPPSADYVKETCAMYATSSTEYSDCVKSAKDVAAMYATTALSSSTLLISISSYQTLYRQLITFDNYYINNATATISVISDVLNSCHSYFDPLNTNFTTDKLLAVNTAMANVQAGYVASIKERADASSSLDKLADLAVKVSMATDTLVLAELTRDLDSDFDLTMLTLNIDTARTRNGELDKTFGNYESIYNSRGNPIPWNPLRSYPQNKCDGPW
ncbi:MAG: hypothetical protein AAB738_00775 [Patescibacteria group bacterium]